MPRAYISTKLITAEEGPAPRQMGEHPAGSPGMVIRYPDGYESWCPIDVFELAYRPVTDAELALIEGSVPAREGDPLEASAVRRGLGRRVSDGPN